ncbi:MAG: hypothetical protein Q9M40_10890 [Sulfurimonas sp.]|nr:hypothetical protein [Sulfurimonas sp.]
MIEKFGEIILWGVLDLANDTLRRRSKIFIAELYRNLGFFDEALSILKDVTSDTFLSMKEKINKECYNKNTLTISL